MNILFVCNKFPYPPKDGGQIAMFAMIRGMAEAGHSVTIAAINTKKHYFDITTLPENIKQLADFHTIFINTDLTIKGVLKNFLFSRLPYTATRFISNEFSNLLKDICKEKKFDIIQLEGLYLCSYIPQLRTYSQAKIAYRAHNVEFEIWQRLAKETKNIAKQLYLKNLAKRVKRFEESIINTYDCLIPITERDGKTYNTLGNSKPQFVAPTGIFLSDLPNIKHTNETISLFHIGALDWAPNQQGILWFLDNCWEEISHQNTQISLHIAGRNAPQWFIDKIRQKNVIYEGEVANAYTFMSQHTMMIVPLLAGGGMRIKILEGLSYGKVIISTSIGAEGISAENNKEICIANTANEFIHTILDLSKNSNKRNEISENAQKFVCSTFDNTVITKRLTNFYTSLQ